MDHEVRTTPNSLLRPLRITFGLLLSLTGAFAAYLFSGGVTAELLYNAGAAAVLFVLLCRWTAGIPWTAAFMCAALVALSLAIPAVVQTVVGPPAPANLDQLLPFLARSAIPIHSVDAESGFEDLAPLREVFRHSRIVALGEATHGTSEFFRMKHRILEFLVAELGFRNFAMELSPHDGDQLDKFINGDDGVDLRKLLYWPWATEEMAAQLHWMRRYNAGALAGKRIRFHGIDPRSGDRDRIMAANVAALVDRSPETKVAVWAHNEHVARAPGAMGSHLKQRYGASHYSLGFEFDHGAWTSRTRTVHTFVTPPAPENFYAAALTRLSSPLLFLDFSAVPSSGIARKWLNGPLLSHNFQEAHLVYRLMPSWHTLSAPWPELYDGILFVRESTPARELRSR